MWTRSAANKITGMIKVTVIDANNVLFFEGEFHTLHEAQAAGEAKNREALRSIMPPMTCTMTDDEILAELLK